jgi:hypothetical protein
MWVWGDDDDEAVTQSMIDSELERYERWKDGELHRLTLLAGAAEGKAWDEWRQGAWVAMGWTDEPVDLSPSATSPAP